MLADVAAEIAEISGDPKPGLTIILNNATLPYVASWRIHGPACGDKARG